MKSFLKTKIPTAADATNRLNTFAEIALGLSHVHEKKNSQHLVKLRSNAQEQINVQQARFRVDDRAKARKLAAAKLLRHASQRRSRVKEFGRQLPRSPR
jgi:hypothetical protein